MRCVSAGCARLEVTKGSFYWHFTDMRAYRSALSAAWANLHDERRRRSKTCVLPIRRERLEEMMQALIGPTTGRSNARCGYGR